MDRAMKVFPSGPLCVHFPARMRSGMYLYLDMVVVCCGWVCRMNNHSVTISTERKTYSIAVPLLHAINLSCEELGLVSFHETVGNGILGSSFVSSVKPNKLFKRSLIN